MNRIFLIRIKFQRATTEHQTIGRHRNDALVHSMEFLVHVLQTTATTATEIGVRSKRLFVVAAMSVSIT